MIPRLVSAKDGLRHQIGAFERRLAALGFRGDVETREGARTVASTSPISGAGTAASISMRSSAARKARLP